MSISFLLFWQNRTRKYVCILVCRIVSIHWKHHRYSNGNNSHSIKAVLRAERTIRISFNLAQTIGQWRASIFKKVSSTIRTLFSLYTAILTLIEHKIHRIPVIDPINHDFLFLITHKRILKFLYLYVCKGIIAII